MQAGKFYERFRRVLCIAVSEKYECRICYPRFNRWVFDKYTGTFVSLFKICDTACIGFMIEKSDGKYCLMAQHFKMKQKTLQWLRVCNIYCVTDTLQSARAAMQVAKWITSLGIAARTSN
jgi:hypothetical protein